jgi:hypothetical protein
MDTQELTLNTQDLLLVKLVGLELATLVAQLLVPVLVSSKERTLGLKVHSRTKHTEFKRIAPKQLPMGVRSQYLVTQQQIH